MAVSRTVDGASAAERRIDTIDSLRALAMTAVVAGHCGIFPIGWMGVWLFFVISGFVVTTSLQARPAAERRSPRSLLTQFYARRAARIWPIYLAYVAVAFVVSGLLSGRFQRLVLASLVLFYNNFQSAFAYGEFTRFQVGHLWTIAVEFQFYLVFGLAFALSPPRVLKWLLAAMLVVSPLLRFAAGVWLPVQGFDPLGAARAIYMSSPMHFDSFAAGALLALHRDAWRRRSRALALLGLGVAAFAAYCLAYGLLNRAQGAVGAAVVRHVISGILFGDQREVWVYSVVAALCAGVLAITVADVPVWRWLTRNPLLQWTGRVSYGGYVYHVICIAGLAALFRRLPQIQPLQSHALAFELLLFVAALPLTVAVASISYRCVEQPIIAAVGRRLRGMSPASVEAAPAVSGVAAPLEG